MPSVLGQKNTCKFKMRDVSKIAFAGQSTS